MAKLEKMTPSHTIYFHAQRNENKGFTIRFTTEAWYINVQLSFNMVQKYKSKFEWYTYNSPGSEYFSRAEIKGKRLLAHIQAAIKYYLTCTTSGSLGNNADLKSDNISV